MTTNSTKLAATAAALAMLASSGCSLLMSLDDVTSDSLPDASATDASVVDTSARSVEASDESRPDVSVDAEMSDGNIVMYPADVARGDAKTSNEAGRTDAGECLDPARPVWCPGRGSVDDGGVAARCWDADTDCSTVVRCADGPHACGSGEVYNCATTSCDVVCTPAFPVSCPAVGSFADGGTTQDCWSAGADCKTVKNCSGVLHACTAGEHFDCDLKSCLVDRDSGPAVPSCDGGLAACGTRCVDLKSDPSNCGACSNACASGKKCFAGECCTPPAAGGTCNLPACGCAQGDVCYPDTIATGLTCQHSADIPQGASCSLEQLCTRGQGCFGGVCKPYCGSIDNCPSIDGSAECYDVTWAGTVVDVPGVRACSRVCDPVTPQTPLNPLLACPVGFGCFPNLPPAGSDCVRQPGTGTNGSACSGAADCMPGFFCGLAKVCQKFCFSDRDCPVANLCTAPVSTLFSGSRRVGWCIDNVTDGG